MKVHFVAVGENTVRYLNELRLLLFSFRKNAHPYQDSPFTIVVNGSSPPRHIVQEIEERYSANVRVMPRISFTNPPTNKFNAFYAIEDAYDALVLMDSDTVVLRPIDGIVAGLETGQAGFRGPVTSNFLVWDTRALIEKYTDMTYEELTQLYGSKLKYFTPRTKKPAGGFMRAPFTYFVDAVIAASRETVETIRGDVVRISHDLSMYGREPRSYGRFVVNRLLTKYLKSPHAWGIHYQRVYSNCLGLSLALLKHRISVDILDDTYNQFFRVEPKEGSARILHYTTRAYPLPREELLTRKWVEAYSTATHRPEAPQLAALIEDYIRTYPG